MPSLSQRFSQIKQRIGGNRETYSFHHAAGVSFETRNHITPPAQDIRRILGQLEFAIKLSAAHSGEFDGDIDKSLQVLESFLEKEGGLIKSVCLQAEQLLMPLSAAAKEYDLICASHAHIDMNWKWGWQETVAATLATFRTMLNLMHEYPDFTFSQSQASVYKIVEDYDRGMIDEIKQRIAEGRWEVTASAWVETDKNMPNTESLLRHISCTREYMEEAWGVDPASLEIDFSPDTFGHSANIPEIDSYGNVKYYYHCRGLDHRQVLYRWRAPSGKELLMYCEPYWYNSGITPRIGIGLIELSDLCGGLKTGLIVYGVGNHGGGPTRRDIEAIYDMQTWPVFPKIAFGTFREFFKKAEAVRDKLPVVDREINFRSTGCYTTQSRIKLGNLRSEAALLDAEGFNALSSLLADYDYPSDTFTRAWRNVLFTHFHDILTGSCVQETREHAIGLYADAMAVANTARENATRALSLKIDTSMIATDACIADTRSEGAGVGFGIENFGGVPSPERGAGKVRIYNIFNPSTHARSEQVEITVWDWIGDWRLAEVVDHNGAALPFQLLDKQPQQYWGHDFNRILVEAKVPALGYITIALREGEWGAQYPLYYESFPRDEEMHEPIVLENDYIRAYFDHKDGALLSLIDKDTGSERIEAGAAGRLVLVGAEYLSNSAWRIGRHLGETPVTKTLRLKKLPGGDLRNGFVMEQKILDSTIETTVTLDRGAKALKYNFIVQWNEYATQDENVPVLTYILPLAQEPVAYQSDNAAGVIRRAANFIEIPGLQYTAAVHDDERAVAIISNCKYGYRGNLGRLAITLINTSASPDKYPERGEHNIDIWVAVDSADAKCLRDAAHDRCHIMNYIPTGSHSGELAPAASLLELCANSTVMSSVGLTRSGDLLARVYETCGQDDKVTIKLPFAAASAALVDLDENYLGSAEVSGNDVTFAISANCIAGVVIKK